MTLQEIAGPLEKCLAQMARCMDDCWNTMVLLSLKRRIQERVSCQVPNPETPALGAVLAPFAGGIDAMQSCSARSSKSL